MGYEQQDTPAPLPILDGPYPYGDPRAYPDPFNDGGFVYQMDDAPPLETYDGMNSEPQPAVDDIPDFDPVRRFPAQHKTPWRPRPKPAQDTPVSPQARRQAWGDEARAQFSQPQPEQDRFRSQETNSPRSDPKPGFYAPETGKRRRW